MPKPTFDISWQDANIMQGYQLDGPSVFHTGLMQEIAQRLPLDKFTRSTLALLARAEQEATQLGHTYVGQEHVLLALFADPFTSALLGDLVNVDTARETILSVIQSPEYQQGSNTVLDKTGSIIGYMYEDEDGQFYIGDSAGNRLRQLPPSAIPYTAGSAPSDSAPPSTDK